MHTEIESKSRITALRERMLRYTKGIGKIVVGWIKKKKHRRGIRNGESKEFEKGIVRFFSNQFSSFLVAINCHR